MIFEVVLGDEPVWLPLELPLREGLLVADVVEIREEGAVVLDLIVACQTTLSLLVADLELEPVIEAVVHEVFGILELLGNALGPDLDFVRSSEPWFPVIARIDGL